MLQHTPSTKFHKIPLPSLWDETWGQTQTFTLCIQFIAYTSFKIKYLFS